MRTGANEPKSQRESNIVGSMAEAELLGDAILVCVDGLGRDAQRARDFYAAVALGDALQHGPLARAQQREILPILFDRRRGVVRHCACGEKPRNAGPNEKLASGDDANRVDEVTISAVL